MRYFSLLTGIALFALFLYTGQWMEEYKKFHAENVTARMGIRANHIYLLFIALLNLMSFQVKKYKGKISNIISNVSRSLFVTAGILIAAGFFQENDGILENRMLSYFAVWTSLIALILSFIPVIITAFSREKKEKESPVEKIPAEV
jgi:hypothetical protein